MTAHKRSTAALYNTAAGESHGHLVGCLYIAKSRQICVSHCNLESLSALQQSLTLLMLLTDSVLRHYCNYVVLPIGGALWIALRPTVRLSRTCWWLKNEKLSTTQN